MTAKILANKCKKAIGRKCDADALDRLRRSYSVDSEGCLAVIWHLKAVKKIFPRICTLTRLLSIGPNRASALLALAKRDDERAEKQRQFLHIFKSMLCSSSERFISNALSKEKPRRVDKLHPLEYKFTDECRDAITRGDCVLTRNYEHDLLRVVLTVPSDSEITFLAVSQNTKKLVLNFFERFGADVKSLPYTFKWEIHKNHFRWHVHLLFPYFKIYKNHNLFLKIRKAWFDTLDDLDAETSCNPFVDSKGVNVQENGPLVNIKPQTDSRVFDHIHSYLAKISEHGKWIPQYRKLSVLNNVRVSAKCHGGVSPALRKMVAKETQVANIYLPTRSLIPQVVFELKALLPNPHKNSWQDIICQELGSRIGEKAKLSPDQFFDAMQTVIKFKNEWEHPYSCYFTRVRITLTPDLIVKITFRKMNPPIKNKEARVKPLFCLDVYDNRLHSFGEAVFRNGCKTRKPTLRECQSLAYYLFCGDQAKEISATLEAKELVSAVIKSLSDSKVKITPEVFTLAVEAASFARKHNSKLLRQNRHPSRQSEITEG